MISPDSNIFQHTPDEVALICQKLLDSKISAGFPQELGFTKERYRTDFIPLIEQAVENSPPMGMIPVLVEPRVPFIRQLALSGIYLDPSVVQLPRQEKSRAPYLTWVRVLDRRDAVMSREPILKKVLEVLPQELRPATPYEGVNADLESVLGHGFVYLPGGEIDKLKGSLTGESNFRGSTFCLDRYLGKPRITSVPRDTYDGLMGLLVALK